MGEDGDHYLPKDFYLLGYDFPAYIAAIEEADKLYKDQVRVLAASSERRAGHGARTLAGWQPCQVAEATLTETRP